MFLLEFFQVQQITLVLNLPIFFGIIARIFLLFVIVTILIILKIINFVKNLMYMI